MRALAVSSTSKILAAAWKVSRANLLTITSITLIVYIPIEVALSFVPMSEEGGIFILQPYFKIQRVLEFWLGTIASLALVHVAFEGSHSRKVSIASAFRRAFERYGSGLWSTFLFHLGFMFGLILLVIPGIALSVFWAFYLPMVVIHDKPGRLALAESARFVKGRWWSFFWPLALLGCLLLLVAILAGGVAELSPESRVLEVLSVIPARLCFAFFLVCLTQLYLLSGGCAEGMEEHSLAEAHYRVDFGDAVRSRLL